MLRLFGRMMVVLTFGGMLAACGDTWEGAKEDTKESAEAADKTIEDTVEDAKDAVQ